MKKPHRVYPQYSSGNFSKTRALVKFALELSSKYKTDSMRDKQREACFVMLYEIYTMLYSGPLHFNDIMMYNFKHFVDSFLLHYGWLRWDARNRHKLEWSMTSKFHYLKHMAMDTISLNPNVGSCLGDEDFVGNIATIASGSTRGTTSLRLPNRVLDKFYRGLAVRWRDQLHQRQS